MELQLSASQIEAIESEWPWTLVLAGPGAGKTETLVRRVLYRVQVARVAPAEIVILTFTNEAANVVRRRLLEHGVGGFQYIGTLHGFCVRLLQRFSGKRINVLSEEQADELLRSAAALLNYKGPFSRLEDRRKEWFGNPEIAAASNTENIVVGTYYRLMRQADSVDYRSILYMGLRVINENRKLIRIEDLLVDEFQDSAPIDIDIYIALDPKTWFIVGDSDQAIYGFRGGNVTGIVNLSNHPGIKLVRLEENYRSIGVICDMAQRLIENNTNRIAKRTISATPNQIGGVSVDREYETGDAEELRRLVEIQQAAKEFEITWSEIALLVRNNDQVDRLIKHAEALGIPVNKRRKMPADWSYARASVDMLVNPANNLVFSFWLNQQAKKEGHDEVTRRAIVAKWTDAAARAGRPLCETIQSDARVWHDAAGKIEEFGLALTLRAMDVSQESVALIESRAADLDKPTLAEIALAIRSTDDPKLTRGEGITITTFHGSKGREWDHVYLLGCEQEIIPGTRKNTDIEAERRLFYVAMTRARKYLFISAAKQRRNEWTRKLEPAELSQFVNESTEAPRIIVPA